MYYIVIEILTNKIDLNNNSFFILKNAHFN